MTETNNNATPVTVLTGFLGAGKTTLLNRILSEPHGRRYAVIVNEFGEIGIDNDLIVDADEEVFEMNNGCVCCTVRGDLIRVIEGLMLRKGRFDGILVETTGLAKPAPVAQTFFVDEEVRAKTRLDAIVTLADAKHLPAQLRDNPEAQEQIAFADIVLLNKTDLVSAEELIAVERQIRALNPMAQIHRTERGAIDLSLILDRHAFDLDRILELDPHFLPDHECDTSCGHHHDHEGHDHNHDHAHVHDHAAEAGIASVSLSTKKLINPQKLLPWLNDLVQVRGPDILRLKGILAFPDEPKRFVVQGVHMILEGDLQRDWKDDEKRISRLVFIGRNLDRAELEAAFLACAA
jgi:G3E family GTPase